MADQSTPVEVFCSYAHADEAWLHQLEAHLSLLKRQGLISLWHNRLIAPGTDWGQIIDQHLETASVILLLVSSDFFASNYCYEVEMQRALERHTVGEARVIPILVRSVDWTNAPFAHLQALPTDAQPITTWPDTDTAMADITAGLRRVITDELPFLQASAPRARLPAIWNVPYPRNPFFLGREEILTNLRHLLHTGQTTALSQPQAISGLGGIGKTQLALEYAYRNHQDYQAVLWASAESAESLVSSYVALALLLHLPEREAKEQEITVQAVKRWFQTHREWLLILDNADDLAILSTFLPPIMEGHVLLTTRATATGQLAHRLEIDTLVPEQGALFLLRRSGLLPPNAPFERASQEARERAEQLSQELGGLPLALDQAGAYMEETGTSLEVYWQLYQEYRAELLRERRGVGATHPLSISTTWLLSFQRVEERNLAAADLLRLLAWLAPDAIAEEILPAGAAFLGLRLSPVAENAWLLNQAIEALRAYSLIQRNPKERMLSIHRLVQAVLQDQQDEVERRIWIERTTQAINAAFPHASYETWVQCERLLPLALSAAQRIEQEQCVSQETGRLLFETATYLQDRGRYVEAEPLYQQALRIQEQILGPKHSDVAYLLHNLAILYFEQGKYAQAEPLYKRALRIQEQVLGPEHSDVAYLLHNLAILYSELGKYALSESLYKRAESMWRRNRDISPLIDYFEGGKYVQTKPPSRALRLREQQVKPQQSDVAYLLNGLASLYFEQGKYAQTEPLYWRALHLWKQQLGRRGHPLMAAVLHNLANLYREQGKYAQAEPLYLRALRIREQQLGSGHPDTAETLHDFAAFQEMQGNQQEGCSLYQRVLTIYENAFGSKHPKTRATQQRLMALKQSVNPQAVAPPQDDTPLEQS